MIEGTKLTAGALDDGAEIETVMLAAGSGQETGLRSLAEAAMSRGARVFEMAPGVMERVAGTVTPQPVLAVARMPGTTLEELASASFLLVCVEMRDPGNLGALIRVADASGADGVICCGGTADPYNPKAVRAAAGAVLHLPVVIEGAADASLAKLGELGFRRFGTAARGGLGYEDVSWNGRIGLVFGNEGSGLPDVLASCIDGLVSIPMAGKAESLNVAAAAAVICFEALRQRSRV